MEPLPQEREVLDGYRQARPESLELVYRAYVGGVADFLRKGFVFSSRGRRLAFTGYSNPDDLQEALQETFLLAFSESARLHYNGYTPFSKYLLGIARNVVLGRFRKDVSRLSCFRQLEVEEGDEQAAPMDVFSSTQVSPEQEAANREIRELVATFVAELTEEQRRLVRLYFMEQLSQEATARSLAVDRNQVRRQIRAIRRKLWKKIKREGLDRALPFALRSLEVKP